MIDGARVGRSILACGLVVSIETEDETLFAWLAPRLPPFSDAPADAAADLTYRVVTSGAGTAVIRGRRTIAHDVSAHIAAAKLVSDLQFTIAQRAAGLSFVHAGVVAIDGRALVLPGASFAGKSTLVAALISAGARYASDEFALIDRDGYIHPYPRPIALRTPDGHDLVPPETMGTVVAGPVPAGAVVFTSFQPDATATFAPVSPGETVLRLIEHGLAARARPLDTLRALRALASRAPGFVTARGEADVFARELMDRMSEWVADQRT